MIYTSSHRGCTLQALRVVVGPATERLPVLAITVQGDDGVDSANVLIDMSDLPGFLADLATEAGLRGMWVDATDADPAGYGEVTDRAHTESLIRSAVAAILDHDDRARAEAENTAAIAEVIRRAHAATGSTVPIARPVDLAAALHRAGFRKIEG